MTDELSKIADDMAGLLPLFVNGGSISGLLLPTQHSARFKAMAIEAKDLIDEALGRGNEYSMNLLSWVVQGRAGHSSVVHLMRLSKRRRKSSSRLHAR